MSKPKNYDPGIHGTYNEEPSLTQQQYREEADINFIMKRYTQTGLLPLGTTETGTYGDFSQVTDYITALDIIKNAHDQFNELDAKVRATFNNDPANFLAFVENPANYDQLREYGFLKKEPEPPPTTPPPKTEEGKK